MRLRAVVFRTPLEEVLPIEPAPGFLNHMKKIAVTLFLILFGLLTLKEGGSALLGVVTGSTPSSYWPPVIALNTFTGLLYLAAALALTFRQSIAAPICKTILGVAAGSALLFFGYILLGGAFETRTVYAILFRLAVASGAFLLVRRFVTRNP